MFSGSQVDQFLQTVVMSNETLGEMQGLANILEQPLSTVLLGEFYYELDALQKDKSSYPAEFLGLGTAACTGIVAQGSDGTIYHGRNQDYPPPFSTLAYQGDVQKGGKTSYISTTFMGISSIGGTCMVPGAFSVEINARGSPSNFDAYLADAAAGKPTASRLVREACARGGDFESAVKYLSETPILGTNVYYVVAGAKPGEGAIISREASGVNSDILRLSQGF